MFCWLCKMLTERHAWRDKRFTCQCRSMWKFGGPPPELQGNPLGLLNPPEFNPEGR